MSKWLINEYPVMVYPSLAVKIGLNEAIILQKIHFWTTEGKGHERDGRMWVYNSYEEWQSNFPFLSESTIKRTIKNLENLKLVYVGNYNKLNTDRTKWYAVNYDELEALSLEPERLGQNDPFQQVNLNRYHNKQHNTLTIIINNNTVELSLKEFLKDVFYLIKNIDIKKSDYENESLDRKFELTQSEKESIESQFLIHLDKGQAFQSLINSCDPAVMILWSLLTQDKKFKNIWKGKIDKTNKKSLAKVIVSYIKEFKRLPKPHEIDAMEDLLTHAEPNVVNRAMRNAAFDKYTYEVGEKLMPYISKVKEIDKEIKRGKMAEKYKDKPSPKAKPSSKFRELENLETDF